MRASKNFLSIGLLFTIQLWRCYPQEFDPAIKFPSRNLQEVAVLSTVHHDDHYDHHRSLQDPPTSNTYTDEFALPFQLIWNMKFTEETTIREPTEDELTGLFRATLNWLLVEVRTYYAQEEVDDVMKLDRIQFTHYGSSFNATDRFPSTVGIEATSFFEANDSKDLPSVFQFLVAFSSGFNRTTLINEYLANAEPIDSLYRNVTKLRYNILPTNLGQSGLTITRTALNTEWDYKVGFGFEDREPTDAEYLGLQNAYNDWLVHVLMDAYPQPITADNNNNNPPVFHLVESSIYSKDFDDSQDPPIHTVRVLTEVSFRQQNEEDGSPPPEPLLGAGNAVTQQDLVNVLNTEDLSKYRDNYLHKAKPNFSLFTGVVSLSWREVDDGTF